MFLSLRKHVRHWSNPLGRCFFQTERDDRTTPVWRAPEGTTTAPVSGCRAWRATHRQSRPIGGRREAWGLAELRADEPSCRSAAQAPLVWRAPEGPVGTGGLRGAAPNAVRSPRGLRCLAAFVATHPATHSNQAPLVWRAPEGPAAVPVGGGGAWPGFEATRRAKLAARTARGRAAAHRHTQRPGPPARGTPAAPQAPPEHAQKETPTAPGMP